MEGTQAHLDFIPERTSDFLFAVFSEEFGFVGNLVLLALYTALIGRSFYIAAFAETRFSRLLAAPSAASSSRTPSSTWAWSVVSCPWWACRCPS